MQINNNFNRTCSPQFGMALKLNKGAEKYLKTKDMEFIKRLKKAGEDMIDFKYFDLELGEQGLRVKSKLYANAYCNPSLNKIRDPHKFPSFNDIEVETVYDGISGPTGQKYPLSLWCNNNSEATMLYDEFNKADYLDRHIILTKKLEEKYQKTAEALKEELAKEKIKSDFIADLMSIFGGESK